MFSPLFLRHSASSAQFFRVRLGEAASAGFFTVTEGRGANLGLRLFISRITADVASICGAKAYAD